MASLHLWHGAVEAFQVKILGNKVPTEAKCLNREEMDYTQKHISEELHELETANNKYEQADALIDMIYVALGGLFKMGIAPGALFDEVHQANMRKVPGSTARTERDAVKPQNWIGPDVVAALNRSLAFSSSLPELFQRVQQKTAQRGKSYNTSGRMNVQVDDYFPHGHPSHSQMVWLKALRMVATVDRDLENPSLPDLAEHAVDLAAYLSFYFDFIMAEARKNVHTLDEVEEKLVQ